MVINNKMKLMFVHIPKNAGTSVASVIDNDWVEIYKHFPANQLKMIDEDMWNEYIKFSIVRNPWDRLYSLYSHIQSTHKQIAENYQGENENMIIWHLNTYHEAMNKDFNEWLLTTKFTPPPQRAFSLTPLTKLSQLSWLTDDDGKIIVDKILTFENIEQEFSQYMTSLGFPNIILTHRNQSKREKKYVDVYNQKSINHVKRYFDEDIKKWNYRFGD